MDNKENIKNLLKYQKISRKLIRLKYKTSINYIIVNKMVKSGRNIYSIKLKDSILSCETKEYLKRFYPISESVIRLPKIEGFYENNIIIFPNYTLINERHIIYKNILRKQRLLENINKQKRKSDEDNFLHKNEIFTDEVMESILKDEIEDQNFNKLKNNLNLVNYNREDDQSVNSMEILINHMINIEKKQNNLKDKEENIQTRKRRQAVYKKDRKSQALNRMTLLNNNLDETVNIINKNLIESSTKRRNAKLNNVMNYDFFSKVETIESQFSNKYIISDDKNDNTRKCFEKFKSTEEIIKRENEKENAFNKILKEKIMIKNIINDRNKFLLPKTYDRPITALIPDNHFALKSKIKNCSFNNIIRPDVLQKFSINKFFKHKTCKLDENINSNQSSKKLILNINRNFISKSDILLIKSSSNKDLEKLKREYSAVKEKNNKIKLNKYSDKKIRQQSANPYLIIKQPILKMNEFACDSKNIKKKLIIPQSFFNLESILKKEKEKIK